MSLSSEPMQIEIARILSPVESLGPGKRLVLWLQGCAIASAGNPCKGCISRDLWYSGDGDNIEIRELSQKIVAKIKEEGLSGITVSGGEPLDQHTALLTLIDMVKSSLPSGYDCDLLLFTHYTQPEILRRFSGVQEVFDALVCGEYRLDLPCRLPLIGSTNQELIVKPAVADKYTTLDQQPRMQFFVEGGDVLFAGIPLAGDIDLLANKLKSRGITFDTVSWEGEME